MEFLISLSKHFCGEWNIFNLTHKTLTVDLQGTMNSRLSAFKRGHGLIPESQDFSSFKCYGENVHFEIQFTNSSYSHLVTEINISLSYRNRVTWISAFSVRKFHLDNDASHRMNQPPYICTSAHLLRSDQYMYSISLAIKLTEGEANSTKNQEAC